MRFLTKSFASLGTFAIVSLTVTGMTSPQPASAATISVSQEAGGSIRADNPDDVEDDRLLFVGNANGEPFRGTMTFDVSGIPDGATINSVSLDMAVNANDGASSADADYDINVHEMTTLPTTTPSWNSWKNPDVPDSGDAGGQKGTGGGPTLRWPTVGGQGR